MPIQCVTFDLDDTLWAIYPVIDRAEAKFLKWVEEHLPRIAAKFTAQTLSSHRHQYFKQYPELHHDLSRLRKNWIAQLMTDHGYTEDKVDDGFNVFWKERNTLELFDDVENVLGLLNKRFRTGAVTNGNADLHQIGIHHYFDFYLTSAQVGNSKPHPAIFDATVSHAQCRPDQILHVGDDPKRDVLGARSAGMRTVWANLKDEEWQENISPDVTITDIADLPDAIDRFITSL